MTPSRSSFGDDDWTTRPLSGRSVYTIPMCALRHDGKAHSFPLNRVALGSDAANDLVVERDTVSRFHALIIKTGDQYLVRDLESTNGTRVNGVRVREAFLSPGVVIEVGDERLEFAPAEEVMQVSPAEGTSLGGLVGVSPPMRQLFDLVLQVAPTDATVLINGETGTGKEVLARTIHDQSHRREGPFVVVDCSAIPPTLIESELFGHEKGSFSGAISGRKGLFEMGNLGTVFLDEIGELPSELQPRLLRVLENSEVRRVGSTRSLELDIRIVAATNRNLAAEVEEGRFRQDLFYRLNVVPVRLPPLRERLDDLKPLVEHILSSARFNRAKGGGLKVEELAPEVLSQLGRHIFPGNVRELVNILEREISLARGPVLNALRIEPAEGAGGRAGTEAHEGGDDSELVAGQLPRFSEAKGGVVAQFEEDYLTRLVALAAGNLSRAARIAGLDRKYLRKLLKKYDMYVKGGGE